MKSKTIDIQQERIGILNVVVIVLTFYVLIALLIESFYNLPSQTSVLLGYIDIVICIFFLFEFSIRFYKAKNKPEFMKWGWIDLVSSIPMIGVFRVGRIFRLIRLIRIIRAFRSTKHLAHHIFASRAQGALTSVSILAVLLVIFSSIAILQVETDPNSNIKTAEDAIWWAYVTITTVGYGDKFPVTTEGRIIAAILMTAGVGLFGTFTAYVASWFVKDRSSDENHPRD
jgi:voltage-gated potassium channel